jgi:hypothetical protein
VQVHAATRVCMYSGIISACTCTKPEPRFVTNRNHLSLVARPSALALVPAHAMTGTHHTCYQRRTESRRPDITIR